MKPLYRNSCLAIVLAFTFTGCSSLFGVDSARSTPTGMRSHADASESTDLAPATAMGRSHLAEGQTALAIESFRQALTSGEPIAPAVNGLGVAYVRLGRFDLAKRYFQQALAIDSTDTRYSDNLERVMLAMSQEIYAIETRNELAKADIEPASSPTAGVTSANTRMKRLASGEIAILTAGKTPENTATGSSPSAASQRGQMVRLSRGEVRITTVQSAPAPVKMASTQLDHRFKPLTRISFAELSEGK